MKIKVNVRTSADICTYDWAEIEIDEALKGRIERFRDVLVELDADYLSEFDNRLAYHLGEPEMEMDCVTLVVSKEEEFWWEGYYRKSPVAWDTTAIPVDVLQGPVDTECDLREFIRDDEDEAGT